MTQPHVFLTTLTGAGRSAEEHGIAKLRFASMASERGWKVTLDHGGSSGVDRARNMMVARFMATECTHFAQVDSGLIFEPEDLITIVESGLGIVGVPYPRKEVDYGLVFRLARAVQTEEQFIAAVQQFGTSTMICNYNTPLETRYVNDRLYVKATELGTAFLVTRRDVIDKYIETYHDEIAYTTDYHPRGAIHHMVFACERDPENDNPTGRYLTEDYAFCRRAARMGETCWAFPDGRVRTLGNWEFRGQWSYHLKAAGFIPYEDGSIATPDGVIAKDGTLVAPPPIPDGLVVEPGDFTEAEYAEEALVTTR